MAVGLQTSRPFVDNSFLGDPLSRATVAPKLATVTSTTSHSGNVSELILNEAHLISTLFVSYS